MVTETRATKARATEARVTASKTSHNTTSIITEGLSFDDVLLEPLYSEVLSKDVNLTNYISSDIKLEIPLLSAAMDTVTESHMAIAMARHGGLGVIHRNLTVIKQREEIRKVKRFEGSMVTSPVSVYDNESISKVFSLMEESQVSSFPVLDAESQKLVGILTKRDLNMAHTDKSYLVRDLMTTELITAPEGISEESAMSLLRNNRIEKLLIVDEQGYCLALMTMRDIMNASKFPNACKDHKGHLRVAAAVGTGVKEQKRVEQLIDAEVDVIVIDTAHGHSKEVIEMLNFIKSLDSHQQVIAGNVATSEATQTLIQHGADAIKVGIGPGSICTTRIVAGVGLPQFSAVYECARVARQHNIPLIADGGIKSSGDVTKALAAGASAVMIGSLFAGTDESPGEKFHAQGRTYKSYRGMGSLSAMGAGSADRYFQQQQANDGKKLVPEGVEGRVPYRGSVSDVVYQLMGGLRSGLGYCGAPDIKSLQDNARFRKITPQGLRESHVHDVSITKEAPNYSLNR